MNMISTGAFLPEMDASGKQETVAEKFARVWEKKNAKAARAGGVSLMALTLAACGSGSSETPVVEVEEEEADTPVVETVVNTYDLTDDDAADTPPDAISGQDGENDIITGLAGTLDAADVIVDDDATDSDELNITLTAAGAAATVEGIEEINVDFDMITGASFDATNVGGATITVTSDRFGFDGTATVAALGANNVTVGAGVTDLIVTDAGTGTVDGGAADTITMDTLAYGATRVAVTNNVTVNGDIALAVAIDENAVSDDYTLNITATAASDVTLTMTNPGATFDGSDGVLTINNTGDVSIVADVATTTDLNVGDVFSEVHINGGRLELTDGAAIDLADIEVDEIEITYGAATNAVTLSNVEDANILVSAEDASVSLTGDGNALTTSDVAVTISDDQDGAASTFDFDVATASIDNATLNIAAADGTARTATLFDVNFAGNLTLNMTDDLAITTLTSAGTTNAGATAYTDDFVVAGTGDLTIGTLGAIQHINAEQLVGGVTATTAAGATLTVNITGGSGDDDITLADVSNTVVFDGGDGDDTLDATTLAVGTIIAEGGAGDDAITIGSVTGTAEVLGGAGDDTITLAGTPTGSVSIDGGAGNDDNLDLAGIDTTGATLTITGIEVIEMGGSVSMDAAAITGQTLTFESDTGTGTLTIDMTATANATLDTSNFTLSEAGGLVVDDIAFSVAGTDTITLGANIENISITGAAAAYTDVDGSGNVDDGDTFLGDFSTITGYDQGTVAAGAITTAEDTLGTRLNDGVLQGDEAAYNGTWDAVTSTFTVNDTAGTDCIIYSAGLGTAVVHLDTVDLIIA